MLLTDQKLLIKCYMNRVKSKRVHKKHHGWLSVAVNTVCMFSSLQSSTLCTIRRYFIHLAICTMLRFILAYRISSNKCPVAYFIQGLQGPEFKRDWVFIQGPALISCRFVQRYNGLTTFSNFGALTWFWALPPGDLRLYGSDGLHLHCENTSCETVWLSSSIWRSKRQSLDERHWEFTWQTDRLTNGRLLDANLADKLRVRAVLEAHPCGTPAFVWNQELISYRAVKPLVFKWAQCLFRSGTYLMKYGTFWLHYNYKLSDADKVCYVWSMHTCPYTHNFSFLADGHQRNAIVTLPSLWHSHATFLTAQERWWHVVQPTLLLITRRIQVLLVCSCEWLW